MAASFRIDMGNSSISNDSDSNRSRRSAETVEAIKLQTSFILLSKLIKKFN